MADMTALTYQIVFVRRTPLKAHDLFTNPPNNRVNRAYLRDLMAHEQVDICRVFVVKCLIFRKIVWTAFCERRDRGSVAGFMVITVLHHCFWSMEMKNQEEERMTFEMMKRNFDLYRLMTRPPSDSVPLFCSSKTWNHMVKEVLIYLSTALIFKHIFFLVNKYLLVNIL